MKLFVVVLAALPKLGGMNCVATKIPAVCLRTSGADAFAQIAKESQGSVVYGLECNIYTKTVEYDLNVSSIASNQELFVILSIAIPVEKGKNPTQVNVYKVCMTQEEAENVFKEICGKRITVGGLVCETQASIIRVKVDQQ